ncbi:hypothetical protein KP07_05625 [Candidatus Liberibacter solanacearum]|nr:hypothetical protein KP07_05625 [Candidatus Liberibacter solanacearum]
MMVCIDFFILKDAHFRIDRFFFCALYWNSSGIFFENYNIFYQNIRGFVIFSILVLYGDNQ